MSEDQGSKVKAQGSSASINLARTSSPEDAHEMIRRHLRPLWLFPLAHAMSGSRRGAEALYNERRKVEKHEHAKQR